MFDYTAGVRDGRAVGSGVAETRGGIPARRRTAPSGSRSRSGVASGAGPAAAPCRRLADPPGTAPSQPSWTLPALRPGVPFIAPSATAVLSVAYRACPSGRRMAVGWRPVSGRAAQSEVDAVAAQPGKRIDLLASCVPYLEVQVRSGRMAPVAHLGDLLARSNLLALCDQ
jgi:hypothetical protein